MANNYTTIPFNSGIYYHPTNAVQDLAHQEIARIYGNGDVVQLVRPERGLKVTGATIAWQQLDSNGTPLLTATARMNNGTTQVNLLNLTAAQLGAAAGGVQGLNVPAGLGFVIPARGWWFEIIFNTAPATGASGQLYWKLDVTGYCYEDEDPTVPPPN
jgi:hypothetical protein